MSKEQPYRHRSEVTGTGSDRPSPETEHRDTARDDAERRNELNPQQRRERDGDGPRTHQDTRIDPDPRFDEPDR